MVLFVLSLKYEYIIVLTTVLGMMTRLIMMMGRILVDALQ